MTLSVPVIIYCSIKDICTEPSQKRVHITEMDRILNSTNKTKSEKCAHHRDEQDTQQYK